MTSSVPVAMSLLPKLTRIAAVALLASSAQAAPDYASRYASEYASARLGEALAQDRGISRWMDMVARPGRHLDNASGGPRTWSADDHNPWANAYGRPMGDAFRSTGRPQGTVGIVPLCACYLPSDARSWDGGPLTAADVARLCRAQCW